MRSVDHDLIKAAQIDGAGPCRIYRRIVLPAIAPIFIAVLVVLLQFAIKTFDLVRALTGGGPGIATTLPAIYVYDLMFQRGQIGRGRRGGDHDPARARRGAGALLALCALARPPRGAGHGCDRRLRPAATAGDLAPRSRASSASTSARLFAAFYLLPLLVVILNSFRAAAGDRRRTALIGLPRIASTSHAWAAGLEHATASAAPARASSRTSTTR